MNPVKVINHKHNIITPDWPAPDYVNAFVTTRSSFQDSTASDAVSTGYDFFNTALHVNDDTEKVLHNRQTLAEHLNVQNSNITWLEQVHGTDIIRSETSHSSRPAPIADACTSSTQNHVCTIMTADCLPVLFCKVTHNKIEQKVAAAHAGWRGLADGILSKTLSEFSQPESVIAWLGPAISQEHFEVGQEVYDAFISQNPKNKAAFDTSPNTRADKPKWLASLTQLAKIELHEKGIKAIYGGNFCTYKQSDLFYSYRRDGAQSGRMASLIMISE
mgnify:CR=1 FL=1